MWLVALVGSNLTDLVISKELLSTTNARKVANTIATMGPALALLGNGSFVFMSLGNSFRVFGKSYL
jgi:hypothetical protein